MRGSTERRDPSSAAIVTALAVTQDAGGGSVLFAASTAGLSRSTDGGRTWVSISPSTNLGLVTALAPSVDFAADETIFAGTVHGVSRSTDGGHSWLSMLEGGQVFAAATVPGSAGDDETAGGGGSVVFAGTEMDGVYRSNDGGVTWGAVNAGLLDLTVLDIAFSPAFDEDGTGFLATASGLYRTRNGGKAWRELDLGMDEPAVQCLAVSPAFGVDGLVLAGTEEHGLLRSDDAGASWHMVPILNGQSVTGICFGSRSPVVALASDSGVTASHDRGETWQRMGQHLGPAVCLKAIPENGRDILVVGLLGGGVALCASDSTEWKTIYLGFV